MGTSDVGAFANDCAADFLADAADAPLPAVRRALLAAADAENGAYLDIDIGQAAHAAAEIVAILFGRMGPEVESTEAGEIAAKLKPSQALRVLALRALDRVVEQSSELASLWNEGPNGPAFLARIDALRARLVDAKSGPRKVAGPKVGDVLEVPHKGEMLVVQLVAPREIVVFRGVCGADDTPLSIAATRDGTRTPCDLAEVARVGRVAGRAPIRAQFKGKKLYSLEVGAIERYAIVTGAHKNWRWVTYDEARDYELHDRRSLERCALLARGEAPDRTRSPDEREAALRRRSKDAWERQRSMTTPGPFGDPSSTESLFAYIRNHGASGIVGNLRESARELVGGDVYAQIRWSYAQVGLLAVWVGRWPITDVPEALRAQIPPKPQDDLAGCMAGARAILDRVGGRESELRMMWEDSPDRGASFRATTGALRGALAD